MKKRNPSDQILSSRGREGSSNIGQKQGVWVFRAEKPLTHAEVERVRGKLLREAESRSVGRRRPS